MQPPVGCYSTQGATRQSSSKTTSHLECNSFDEQLQGCCLHFPFFPVFPTGSRYSSRVIHHHHHHIVDHWCSDIWPLNRRSKTTSHLERNSLACLPSRTALSTLRASWMSGSALAIVEGLTPVTLLIDRGRELLGVTFYANSTMLNDIVHMQIVILQGA
ncbi:hypothetical protein BDZ89DRAFT_400164 [Hymenopellis radicata]|nr:hypothetical protein BDZ89DRAFT_400164 [Hymenopellis radicata]